MAGFQIRHAGKVIGTSALEAGDAPMACAHGIFLPGDAYAGFSSTVVPEPDDDPFGPGLRRWIGLDAQLADGTPIDCVDVVLFEYDFGE